MQGEDGPVCLGWLSGDAGIPGDAPFSDQLELLLAQWKTGNTQSEKELNHASLT